MEAHEKILREEQGILPNYRFSDFPVELVESIEACEHETHALTMLDDDRTQMEFVVALLVRMGMEARMAKQHMITIHETGSSVLLTSDYPVVESVAEYISSQARLNDFPLQCTIEEI